MEGFNVVVEVACWMVDNVGWDWPSHSFVFTARQMGDGK